MSGPPTSEDTALLDDPEQGLMMVELSEPTETQSSEGCVRSNSNQLEPDAESEGKTFISWLVYQAKESNSHMVFAAVVVFYLVSAISLTAAFGPDMSINETLVFLGSMLLFAVLVGFVFAGVAFFLNQRRLADSQQGDIATPFDGEESDNEERIATETEHPKQQEAQRIEIR